MFFVYFAPNLHEYFKDQLKKAVSQKITAAITAVGGFVPEEKLTNADLMKLVDTNEEWIRTRTGIEERRILRGEGKSNIRPLRACCFRALQKKRNQPR